MDVKATGKGSVFPTDIVNTKFSSKQPPVFIFAKNIGAERCYFLSQR